MLVFPVGGPVVLLRFLPDGRRLFVGTGDGQTPVRFAVHPVHGGDPVPLVLADQPFNPWVWAGSGNPVGFGPCEPAGLLAWAGTAHPFDPDTGRRAAGYEDVAAHQLATSPDGSRRLLAGTTPNGPWEMHGFADGRQKTSWYPIVPERPFALGGFLPDGDRFVTVEAGTVRIRSFATGEYLAAGRHKLVGVTQSTVSPDGRFWAGYGYHSFYLVPLDPVGPPRRIKGGQAFGDFRSFAFHPAGRRLAVIHGGPTLVKLYAVDTLTRAATFKWKLGPLHAVAFSPDGTLAAAGSADGRVVVWDVED